MAIIKRKVVNKPVEMHMYSKQIASQINPRMPDVAAASVLYNLSFWQNNIYKQTLIDAKRHSFRSITQLRVDQPYLSRSAIHACIKRLENKLGQEFSVRRDKDVLYYHIGEATMKRLSRLSKKADRDTLISFYVEDAKKYGIRSAVLLQNLDYATLNFTSPLQDSTGQAYAELSATKLSAFIGYSTDTIQRALADLKKDKVLVSHPIKIGFYRRAAEPAANVEGPAVVNNAPAIANDAPADVDGTTADLNAATLENECQALILRERSLLPDPSDITEDINSDTELDIKDSIYRFPVGESDSSQKLHEKNNADSRETRAHSVMQKLSIIVDAKIQAMRQKRKFGIIRFVEPVGLELPYDDISSLEVAETQVYDPMERSRRDSDVELMVENAEAIWRLEFKMEIDDDDREKLARLFRCNWRRIDEGHLLNLYRTVLFGEFTCPGVPPKPWTTRILQKVKTPKQFLRYLPQILTQVYGVEGQEDFPDEWAGFDFSYLGRLPKSSLVEFADRVEIEYVDQEFAMVDRDGRLVVNQDAN